MRTKVDREVAQWSGAALHLQPPEGQAVPWGRCPGCPQLQQDLESLVSRLPIGCPRRHRAGEEKRVPIPAHVAGEEFASSWALTPPPWSERLTSVLRSHVEPATVAPNLFRSSLLASAPSATESSRAIQGPSHPELFPVHFPDVPATRARIRSSGSRARELPEAACRQLGLQPPALVRFCNGDSWPGSCWPLVSGLRAIPRPPGGEPDTFN